MEDIISQAPVGISDEEIIEIYNKNDKDKLKTLFELWNMPENIKEKPFNKFDEIRETCDAFDIEMAKLLKGEIKLNNNNKEDVNN
jgi:hypothetical protein